MGVKQAPHGIEDDKRYLEMYVGTGLRVDGEIRFKSGTWTKRKKMKNLREARRVVYSSFEENI